MPLKGWPGNEQRISIWDGSVLQSERCFRRGRYLTKVQVICLMPSAGMDAPIGGLVTVTPAISTTRKRDTHDGGDEEGGSSEEEGDYFDELHGCGRLG